jgi:hypothetical protein
MRILRPQRERGREGEGEKERKECGARVNVKKKILNLFRRLITTYNNIIYTDTILAITHGIAAIQLTKNNIEL